MSGHGSTDPDGHNGEVTWVAPAAAKMAKHGAAGAMQRRHATDVRGRAVGVVAGCVTLLGGAAPKWGPYSPVGRCQRA